MDHFLSLALIAVLGYLIGAVPFGYLLARWRGVDILRSGSGNIGATNVGRLLGRRFGVLVFAFDFAKGAVPALGGLMLADRYELAPRVLFGVMGGLAAFVGHLFPVYLGFRGGKGVATGAGVVAVLVPVPALAGLATWVLVLAVFRYVSLASLAAGLSLLGTYAALTPVPLDGEHRILTVFCLFTVALVFVKHRSNIHRLLHRTENRLSDGPLMRTLNKTIHVLAVGLWFGMAVFFSFPVALSLFSAFEGVAQENTRPTWFPLPPDYKAADMQKDQGTRAAGFAISPLFDQYFLWQALCGVAATITALGLIWAEPRRAVHKVRLALLIVAAGSVILVGWPLERHVSALRLVRNEASDEVMLKTRLGVQKADMDQTRATADAARKEFGTWHVWSLLLNMVTIALVTVAMALTAQMPGGAVSTARDAKKFTEEMHAAPLET